ncbi:hypothetical protein BV898_09773 [Hypsibius exemplaris]|uniref:Cystatin domain-containing protein n=1 Tax=Hypsibius exemplaris TaxID=2072580 RepID=A0A1W0WLQ8_HYPEX|nr:hypothetical protein BV898_09773 [Hypsibius exemplaris]
MSATQPINNNAQQAANQVINLVQEALGGQLTQYRPVSFRYQVVPGGVNYFIKVLVTTNQQGSQYVHLRVGVPTNQIGSLNGMELNRQLADPISYIYIKQCPVQG